MAKKLASVAEWARPACMASAAAAGTTAQYLFGLHGAAPGGTSLSLETLLTGLGVGVTGLAAGVLAGRLGNVVHDRLKQQLTDPETLFRNQHLATARRPAARTPAPNACALRRGPRFGKSSSSSAANRPRRRLERRRRGARPGV